MKSILVLPSHLNQRSTSIIATVIFGVLVGIAARKVMLEKTELASPIRNGVNALQATVMSLVRMVIALTPYGVAGLMASVVANSSSNDILNLLAFIVASYVAILLMFVVHGLLLSFVPCRAVSSLPRCSSPRVRVALPRRDCRSAIRHRWDSRSSASSGSMR